MRLNTGKYKQIMTERNITVEDICKRTGLLPMACKWILDNGFTEIPTIQCLADIAGVPIGEISRSDPTGCCENGIEFFKGSSRATVQFTSGKFSTRIKKLAEKFPDECDIVIINQDGSMIAHIPVDWIKINPPARRSESQVEAARQNIKKYLSQQGNNM